MEKAQIYSTHFINIIRNLTQVQIIHPIKMTIWYKQDSLTGRYGKLEVLAKILPLWKKQGHRVLIFSQWKNAFNNDASIFTMLLTTKTGGVWLNLTGADRIILYDLDWNPQSDTQARERAWRFGQRMLLLSIV